MLVSAVWKKRPWTSNGVSKARAVTLALFDECAWFSGLLISAGIYFLFPLVVLLSLSPHSCGFQSLML